jgi:hypothetical protein
MMKRVAMPRRGACDPRWARQRAVGSAAFLRLYLPHEKGTGHLLSCKYLISLNLSFDSWQGRVWAGR